jgi:hypothetical protein
MDPQHGEQDHDDLQTGHQVTIAFDADRKGWRIVEFSRLAAVAVAREFDGLNATFEQSFPEPNGWSELRFATKDDAYRFLEENLGSQRR